MTLDRAIATQVNAAQLVANEMTAVLGWVRLNYSAEAEGLLKPTQSLKPERALSTNASYSEALVRGVLKWVERESD